MSKTKAFQAKIFQGKFSLMIPHCFCANIKVTVCESFCFISVLYLRKQQQNSGRAIRAQNSNSGVSDQQSVGSNPYTHLTITSSIGWDVKPLVPFVVQRMLTNPVHLSNREGVLSPLFSWPWLLYAP